MSRHEESQTGDISQQLQAVERFWKVRLPEAFCRLYLLMENPFLAPCEFFSLKSIALGAGRSYGMTPQFLPFGRTVGEGGLYGFYLTSETELGSWPVLCWDEDEMFLRPVASDFEAFLKYCILVGRYEMETQWPNDIQDGQDAAEQEQVAHRLRIPSELLFGALPRNDTELSEWLVKQDAQDAVSLCRLGCMHRNRQAEERALDYYSRAMEAAPWFGDPLYLMADVYRHRSQFDRAIEGWWSVVQRLLPLCTRTWEWDLGEDHPEADIYEVAADCLAQHCQQAPKELRALPLWQVIVNEDPYDPDVREALGDSLLARKLHWEAEREYLNALYLCNSETGRQPERLYDALQTLYERSGRIRDAALIAHDRSLPRTTVE